MCLKTPLTHDTRWHADIKPDNILSVKGKFKLADPGFAKFTKRTDKEENVVLRGGTETYGNHRCSQRSLITWLTSCTGAPERHPGRTTVPVSRAIDIWSLGCVFSIAATWVVFGYQGIRQFNKVREKAIARLIREQRAEHAQHSAKTSELGVGDYFHNTRDVLQEVILWHNVLRSTVRKTDTITCQVLDLVDSRMLQGRAENRIPAKELCEELVQISQRSKNDGPRIPVDPSIMDALIEVDNEAPSNTADSLKALRESRVFQERTAPKSKRLDYPLMKTTHRSQYRKTVASSETDVSDENPADDNGGPSTGPRSHITQEGIVYPPADLIYTPPRRGDEVAARYPRPDVFITPAVSYPIRPYKPYKSRKIQTVFQARAELKRQSVGINKVRGIFGGLTKDELLTKHFNNRDIVSTFIFTP
jgi:serine/threonine protein kinase